MIKELMHAPIFPAGKSEVATKDDLQVANDLLGADMFQYDYSLHCIVHIYGRSDPEGVLRFF